MGYYRAAGDYYGRGGRGDYYKRGDPFLGALAPLAGGLIKRGVSALIARAGGRGAAGAAAAIGTGVAIRGVLPTGFGGPGGGVTVRPRAILPGGAPFISASEAPRGFHQAKDGSGRWVRNRRMNVTNPKALRKAIRRMEGFGGLVKHMRKAVRSAARTVG